MQAVKLLSKAIESGIYAGNEVVPTPMTVEGYAPISEGMCGFAWVRVVCNNRASRLFINQLKKAGLATDDINSFDNKAVFKKSCFERGYTYWVSDFGQSYERKKAFARAMTAVLRMCDVNAMDFSRLD